MAGGALVALLASVAISYVSDHRAGEKSLTVPAPTAAVIARGAYLARLGDCAACHSLPARPAFSGGLRMRTPIGAIYTTNITPDPSHGIGRFTLADFDRALRFGVSEGHTLYPAMPYTSTTTRRQTMSLRCTPISSMQCPRRQSPTDRAISCSPFPCAGR